MGDLTNAWNLLRSQLDPRIPPETIALLKSMFFNGSASALQILDRAVNAEGLRGFGINALLLHGEISDVAREISEINNQRNPFEGL